MNPFLFQLEEDLVVRDGIHKGKRGKVIAMELHRKGVSVVIDVPISARENNLKLRFAESDLARCPS